MLTRAGRDPLAKASCSGPRMPAAGMRAEMWTGRPVHVDLGAGLDQVGLKPEFYELEALWPDAAHLALQLGTLNERWDTNPERYS